MVKNLNIILHLNLQVIYKLDSNCQDKYFYNFHKNFKYLFTNFLAKSYKIKA